MNVGAKRTAAALLLWGAALGLAYGQSPLYTSNQNQYFLHGLAHAGVGSLSADWLANTRDPTPLFSGLVRLMALSVGAEDALAQLALPLNAVVLLNYLLYLLIFAVYLASAFGISHQLYSIRRSRTMSLLFFGLLFVSHSAALRYALAFVPGGEWSYLFDGGIGGQRLLGPVFQPSVFGALLLLSIWLYLEQRPLPAMLATVVAASFHPTYLLTASCLSAVYWIAWIRRSTVPRRPLLAGAAALALVLPIVLYVYANFLPPSAVAQEIMVEFRIPEHAVPVEWFDLTTLFKLGLTVAALGLVRNTRLRPVMLALLAVGTALTALQIVTGSLSLALLFPWRLSATLVPLASAVLAGRIAVRLATNSGRAGTSRGDGTVAATGEPGGARWLESGQETGGGDRHSTWRLRPSVLRAIGLALVALAVISGIGWSAVQFAQRRSMPERRVFEYVRRTQAAGQLYLVPAGMQDFRLATGAPILADFKSIPYFGPEVLEWHQRVRLLNFFYRGSPEQVDCGLLEVFAGEYGVTHVVLEPDQGGLQCDRLEPRYDDGEFSVHAIVSSK